MSMSLQSVNFQEKINHLSNQNKNLLAENERLYGIIRLLKKDKFGSKAERFSEVPPEQLAFDNFKKEVSKEPEKPVTVTYKRKKGRSPGKGVPDDLPREEKIIDLLTSCDIKKCVANAKVYPTFLIADVEVMESWEGV